MVSNGGLVGKSRAQTIMVGKSKNIHMVGRSGTIIMVGESKDKHGR